MNILSSVFGNKSNQLTEANLNKNNATNNGIIRGSPTASVTDTGSSNGSNSQQLKRFSEADTKKNLT
jgi:hypothetical protein